MPITAPVSFKTGQEDIFQVSPVNGGLYHKYSINGGAFANELVAAGPSRAHARRPGDKGGPRAAVPSAVARTKGTGHLARTNSEWRGEWYLGPHSTALMLATTVVQQPTSVWVTIVVPFIGAFSAIIVAGIALYPTYRKRRTAEDERNARIDATCDYMLGRKADRNKGRYRDEPGLVHLNPPLGPAAI